MSGILATFFDRLHEKTCRWPLGYTRFQFCRTKKKGKLIPFHCHTLTAKSRWVWIYCPFLLLWNVTDAWNIFVFRKNHKIDPRLDEKRCTFLFSLFSFFCIVLSLQTQMFRALAILASIVGASAFAPVARVARSSSLKMDYSVSIINDDITNLLSNCVI